MSKEICMKKIAEIIDPQLKAFIISECSRLFDCGGVDTAKYQEELYELPRAILYVAIKNALLHIEPYSKQSKDDAKNLLNF